jgi:hypothetical protein
MGNIADIILELNILIATSINQTRQYFAKAKQIWITYLFLVEKIGDSRRSARELSGSGITWKVDSFEQHIPVELNWDTQIDGFRYYDVRLGQLTFSCG